MIKFVTHQSHHIEKALFHFPQDGLFGLQRGVYQFSIRRPWLPRRRSLGRNDQRTNDRRRVAEDLSNVPRQESVLQLVLLAIPHHSWWVVVKNFSTGPHCILALDHWLSALVRALPKMYQMYILKYIPNCIIIYPLPPHPPQPFQATRRWSAEFCWCCLVVLEKQPWKEPPFVVTSTYASLVIHPRQKVSFLNKWKNLRLGKEYGTWIEMCLAFVQGRLSG